MKKILAIFIIWSISFSAIAQKINKEVSFIRAVIKPELKSVYVDRLFDSAIESIAQATSKDTLVPGKLILVKADRIKVRRWIADLQKVKLQQGLITGARMIGQDSILSILRNKEQGWNYFYANLGKCFYQISPPLFLSADRFSLFYQSCTCGKFYGESELSVYEYINSKWRKVRTLYSIHS